MLATQSSKQSVFMNDIFGITSYFMCKLLDIRPQSIQEKFMGFFQNDPLSQNFFRQWYEYIEVHKDKLSNDVLDDFYRNKLSKDELSQKWYLIDKNLEKQVVSMLKLLCSEDNKDMQNYIRNQENSAKSYNFVSLIADYIWEFQYYLQYPVAYDTFIACVDALFEFVQGPNFENQDILIHRNFVELWNKVLMLEYKETNNSTQSPG